MTGSPPSTTQTIRQIPLAASASTIGVMDIGVVHDHDSGQRGRFRSARLLWPRRPCQLPSLGGVTPARPTNGR